MSKFTLDESGYRLCFASEEGPTGQMLHRTLAGMRDEVQDRQRRRIGKVVYETTSGITRVSDRGLVGSVTMRHTRAHIIRPRSAPRLVFVPRGQSQRVFAKIVHHPGSTPPARYLLDALSNARGVKG